MTLNEIAKVLALSRACLTPYFQQATMDNSVIASNIRQKMLSSKTNFKSDYNWEETMKALKHFSKAQKLYLSENFIHRSSNIVHLPQKPLLSKDASNFLQNPKPACASCYYMTPRHMNFSASRLSPFCSLFSCFLNKATPKRNIYKDTCPAFKKSLKFTIFTTKGTILKPNNTTLGIPNSSFSSGLTPKNQPIPLVIPQKN